MEIEPLIKELSNRLVKLDGKVDIMNDTLARYHRYASVSEAELRIQTAQHAETIATILLSTKELRNGFKSHEGAIGMLWKVIPIITALVVLGVAIMALTK